MGYKTIDLLLSEGMISDPADIFIFDPDQLLGREGWGEISVDQPEAGRSRPPRTGRCPGC